MDIEKLQKKWKILYTTTLPTAAAQKSNAQTKWTVHVDHCFARIILDKVVGEGKEPWIGKIKSPAYKNMTKQQLIEAIELAEKILEGKEDLIELDQSSLRSRGKAVKNHSVVDQRKRANSGKVVSNTKIDFDHAKHLAGNEETPTDPDPLASPSHTSPHAVHKDSIDKSDADAEIPAKNNAGKRHRVEYESVSKYFSQPDSSKIAKTRKENQNSDKSHTASLLKKIEALDKTEFQKRVLCCILQIPPSRYSTYGLLSAHLESSPRAVGNALRGNPLAPDVPCHRILATGGGLGGFGGSWGKGGKAGANDDKKRELLSAEGVRFDGSGKVVGQPWSDYT